MNTKLPKSTTIRISGEDDVPPPGISPETLDAISEAIDEIAAEEEASKDSKTGEITESTPIDDSS